MEIIKAENLTFRYEDSAKKVLEQFNLTIEKGSFTASADSEKRYYLPLVKAHRNVFNYSFTVKINGYILRNKLAHRPLPPGRFLTLINRW